jgi:hypothetical protein
MTTDGFLRTGLRASLCAMTRTGSSPGRRWGWLLVGLALAPSAWAGSISISITPTVEWAADDLTATVKISNSGDEAAQTVMPQITFRGKTVRGTGKAALNPSESIEEKLTVPAPGLGNGRWPYHLAVDYTDLNQYPFQALQVGTFTVGNPQTPKLSVRMDPLQLATSGKLNLTLKNLAAAPREATVTLYVPDGVEVTAQPSPVSLDAYGETSLAVALVNHTALAGSRYPVFASGEYAEGDVHNTVVGQGSLEIVPPRSLLADNRSVLWVVSGIAIALWAAVLVWRLTGSRPAVPQG